MSSKLLFRYDEPWTEQAIARVHDAMAEIALNDLGLSTFTNQITIVSETGMLDAYANTGMPHMYPHWSFGKRWQELKADLKKGDTNLAYEMVIPTDPCVSWNMASNGMATMALVIAHAAFGHNAVFKNNYLFKKWTHPRVLKDYCDYARDAILGFEKLHGIEAVEAVLDAAHALAIPCGVFRYSEPMPFDLKLEKKRLADRLRAREANVDLEMLRTVPGYAEQFNAIPDMPTGKPNLPQENILYFIEQNSPRLAPWEREIIRIVRTIAQQVGFPMYQTKTLNEGAATFTHTYIMQKLFAQGRLDTGTMMELARLNSGVLYQQEYRHSGRLSASFNPYTVGLNISQEIVRVSGMDDVDKAFFQNWINTDGPTEEDKKWFSFAGDGDWRARLRHAWYDYRDDTFIEQFLTPNLMRKWQLFALLDEQDSDAYVVTDTVHERTLLETGYEALRHKFAETRSWEHMFPDIRVTDADLLDDRTLTLTYYPRESMKLTDEVDDVLTHVEELWGYEVVLEAADEDEDEDED